MPVIPKPVLGNFCWTEVFLDDPSRGKGFYGELFGWGSQDIQVGHGPYHLMNIGGAMTAGISKLADVSKKTGGTAQWVTHVFVHDTNAAAEKAKSLGAKIMMGPMQVGPGLMAILEDPEGGHLALWATQNPLGPFLWDEPGALCWNEFVAADVDRLTQFYAGLFGWKTEKLAMGDFTYTLLKNGDLPIGGVMPKSHALPGAPTSWTAYFRVNDCDATVKKAEKLGAKRSSPPRDVPNWGRFSILGDPEGVSFAILQKSAK